MHTVECSLCFSSSDSDSDDNDSDDKDEDEAESSGTAVSGQQKKLVTQRSNVKYSTPLFGSRCL